TGALQQRIHGVVDLYGAQKPSYQLLRSECSPIESLTVEHQSKRFRARIKTRSDLPMYTLRGYKLRGLFFGEGNIPVEQQTVELPETTPGGEVTLEITFTNSEPLR